MNSESNNSQPQPQPPIIVWWFIWSFILGMFFTVVGLFDTVGIGQVFAVPALLILVPILCLVVCFLIRFLVFPRIENPTVQFQAFIFGIALAEACGILTLLLIPQSFKILLIAGSIVGIICYVPRFLFKRAS